MEPVLGCLGVIALIPFLLLYSAFSWGYVAYIFWGWFIIGVIPDAPVFNVYQFIGFRLVLNVLISHNITFIKEEYKEKYTVTASLLGPWLSLLCGYLIYIFIK